MIMEKFEDLIGRILVSVENHNNEELVFTLDTGEKYKLYHDYRWGYSEDVRIEDIVGDLSDLVGSPLLMAEEVSHANETPDGVPRKGLDPSEYKLSYTWTFYKLATLRGYITIRWYGVSSGDYSESVDWGIA